jgi:hypothetical protein
LYPVGWQQQKHTFNLCQKTENNLLNFGRKEQVTGRQTYQKMARVLRIMQGPGNHQDQEEAHLPIQGGHSAKTLPGSLPQEGGLLLIVSTTWSRISQYE